MSLWVEGNSIDNILSLLQNRDNEGFLVDLQRRRKALKQIEEIVDKHYIKKADAPTRARVEELYGVDSYVVQHRNEGLPLAGIMHYTEKRRKELNGKEK